MSSSTARVVVVLGISALLSGACGTFSTQRTVGPDAQTASSPARVAVVITGKKSARVRAAVNDMLGEQYQVVTQSEYRKAARRLKARKMTSRHVASVSAKLDVDIVLQGRVTRKRKRGYRLSLKVRDGKTGKIVDRFGGKLRTPRLARADRDFLTRELMPVIDTVAPHRANEHRSKKATRVARKANKADKAKRARKADKAKKAHKADKAKRAHKADKAKKAHTADKAKKAVAAKKRKGKKRGDEVRVARADKHEDIDEDSGPAFVERYDDRGQVIDDDVPDMFSKHR